jgi:hypothetical protein
MPPDSFGTVVRDRLPDLQDGSRSTKKRPDGPVGSGAWEESRALESVHLFSTLARLVRHTTTRSRNVPQARKEGGYALAVASAGGFHGLPYRGFLGRLVALKFELSSSSEAGSAGWARTTGLLIHNHQSHTKWLISLMAVGNRYRQVWPLAPEGCKLLSASLSAVEESTKDKLFG